MINLISPTHKRTAGVVMDQLDEAKDEAKAISVITPRF